MAPWNLVPDSWVNGTGMAQELAFLIRSQIRLACSPAVGNTVFIPTIYTYPACPSRCLWTWFFTGLVCSAVYCHQETWLSVSRVWGYIILTVLHAGKLRQSVDDLFWVTLVKPAWTWVTSLGCMASCGLANRQPLLLQSPAVWPTSRTKSLL